MWFCARRKPYHIPQRRRIRAVILYCPLVCRRYQYSIKTAARKGQKKIQKGSPISQKKIRADRQKTEKNRVCQERLDGSDKIRLKFAGNKESFLIRKIYQDKFYQETD